MDRISKHTDDHAPLSLYDTGAPFRSHECFTVAYLSYNNRAVCLGLEVMLERSHGSTDPVFTKQRCGTILKLEGKMRY